MDKHQSYRRLMPYEHEPQGLTMPKEDKEITKRDILKKLIVRENLIPTPVDMIINTWVIFGVGKHFFEETTQEDRQRFINRIDQGDFDSKPGI